MGQKSFNLIIMIHYSGLFVVIAVIAFLVSLSGYTVSVVPGWHTTIYPPYYLISMAQLVWIALLPVFYRLLEKRKREIPREYFLIHLCTTLTIFIPLADWLAIGGYYINWLPFIIPLVIFILGQLLFLIVFINLPGTKRNSF